MISAISPPQDLTFDVSELPQLGHLLERLLPLGYHVYPHDLHSFCGRLVAAIFIPKVFHASQTDFALLMIA